MAIAILNIVVGLIGTFFHIPILNGMGIGIGSIIFGIIMLILTAGIKKRKVIAPYIISFLLLLDIAMSFYIAVTEDNSGNPTVGIVLKVFLIAVLIKAGGAIKKLKKQLPTK